MVRFFFKPNKFPCRKTWKHEEKTLVGLLTAFLFSSLVFKCFIFRLTVSVLIRWNVYIINIRIDYEVNKRARDKRKKNTHKRQYRPVITISVCTVPLIINYLAIGCPTDQFIVPQCKPFFATLTCSDKFIIMQIGDSSGKLLFRVCIAERERERCCETALSLLPVSRVFFSSLVSLEHGIKCNLSVANFKTKLNQVQTQKVALCSSFY